MLQADRISRRVESSQGVAGPFEGPSGNTTPSGGGSLSCGKLWQIFTFGESAGWPSRGAGEIVAIASRTSEWPRRRVFANPTATWNA
jgi:hypothetical protein